MPRRHQPGMHMWRQEDRDGRTKGFNGGIGERNEDPPIYEPKQDYAAIAVFLFYVEVISTKYTQKAIATMGKIIDFETDALISNPVHSTPFIAVCSRPVALTGLSELDRRIIRSAAASQSLLPAQPRQGLQVRSPSGARPNQFSMPRGPLAGDDGVKQFSEAAS